MARKMKDSGVEWIGEIPETWEISRCKKIFRITKKTVGSQSNQFTLLSLTKQGIIKRDIDNPQGKFPAEFDSYQVVTPGDFVFCLFDVEETPRTVELSSLHGMITGAYTVMECLAPQSRRYIYYQFLSFDDDKKLSSIYTGMRKTIPKSVFMGIQLAFPPPPEQQAIAAFLDRETMVIDKRLSLTGQKKQLLVERRKATIHEAVTKGLDRSVPMKDSGVDWIGDIPEGWHLSVAKRHLVYKKEQNKNREEANILSLTLKGVLRNNPDNPIGLVPSDYASYQIFEDGDFVFKLIDLENTQTSRIGLVWERGIMSPAYIRIRPNKKESTKYLYWFFRDMWHRNIFQKLGGNGVRSSLSASELLKTPITLPSVEEQQAIAAFLDRETSLIDRQIEALTKMEGLLIEQRKALIHEAVTGKIEIS